ncbi:MAG: hypothetical protein AVO39_00360 [delta proteobacterium MLS_D]|jgi:polyhydroxyalkanoate synthesis regulator phasin|nr:MAG: hypothetical protein AVO39_00360 [delta proteobacterium MLS_D]
MSNLIRKGMLMGFGILSLTREKAEEWIDELVRRGEISEKEGREAVDEFVEKSKEMRRDLSSRVESAVEEAVKKMNLATRDDLDKLKKKITALEKTVKSGE